MKKIMFLIGSLNGGGAERVLVDTLNNLPLEKYEITLILVENSGIYINELLSNIQVIYLTDMKKMSQKKWLYRFIHYIPFGLIYPFYVRERYDIEIAFLEGLPTHIVGSSPYKSKKIAWVHTDMDENRWADIDFKTESQQRKIYHRFDQIICVSEFCREKFIKRFGTDYSVTTVYNLVCDDKIKAKAEEINDDIPEKKRFTFISSGRFTVQKGFDRLLKIHKRLIEDGYMHDLWLLGDGIMKDDLEQYIKEYGLQETVKLLGFQRNPYPFMAKADCFVCSSRSEGYSTVVTEAFIINVPVISVRCSGASELLGNGEYGLLVDNNNNALYEGIKKILSDNALYERLKQKAYMRGHHFTKAQGIQGIENILDAD